MNLAVLYEMQEQKKRRAEVTFGDKTLTPHQVRMYRTLKEAIRTRVGVLHPSTLNALRGSGKTMVLLKLAEELDVPLVTNHSLGRILRRDYPHLTLITPGETARLRGSRYRGVLVDEYVDLNRIDPGIRILTGINRRNDNNDNY
ncbi:hypothetical protein P8918_13280 [Bacillus spizizenii]|nr:hypothetical protein [Bacillus spizizenii]MCY8890540.1 hypothetical protein [Bacillus spizizenii]MEC0841999.1 hypothetical protein [Bacillus spizizenii]